MPNPTKAKHEASIEDELRKIVDDSVRHSRANLGYTLNNHEAGEQNIAMNVETIMAAIRQYAAKARIDELESTVVDDEGTIIVYPNDLYILPKFTKAERIKQLKKGQV